MPAKFINNLHWSGSNLQIALLLLFFSKTIAVGQNIPFNFNNPDRQMTLDSQLQEISGISMYKNDTTLLAIQDESGTVFTISGNTGAILKKTEFTGKGDFEDIQYASPFVFANKSNGSIFQLDASTFKLIKSFESGLEKLNDVEGMFYSSTDNSLLLACKGPKDQNPGSENARLVFRYDLKAGRLIEKPIFHFTKDAFIEFVSKQQDTRENLDLKANYNNNVPEFSFGPSAIAQDPITKNYYILSSAGKVLVVVKPNGEMVDIIKLHKKIYLQPEGLSFDSKGNLYIASEGKKKVATLSFHKRL
ncbi:hypothetical protein MASR1M65_17670 [Saprospiraceae bacterium]